MKRRKPAKRSKPPQHRYTEAQWASVILANLTVEEYDAFYAARVSFSGATGKGACNGYAPYGPYIATFMFELPAALEALGWNHVALRRVGNSWIARRS